MAYAAAFASDDVVAHKVYIIPLMYILLDTPYCNNPFLNTARKAESQLSPGLKPRGMLSSFLYVPGMLACQGALLLGSLSGAVQPAKRPLVVVAIDAQHPSLSAYMPSTARVGSSA